MRDGREFWEVFINGGRKPTGLEAVAWAKEVERLGAGEIVLTSMDRDGTCDGYDIEITAAVSQAVRIPWWPAAEQGGPNTWPMPSNKAKQMLSWRPVFFTSVSIQ